ncbi:MAG: response regulator [Gammaproteobacteria bacterium]|nr:response regulator [Gammaproteobacteria bacterium]
MEVSKTKLSLLGKLKRRLKRTGDTEPEQTIIRLAIASILVIYFCLPWGDNERFTDILHSTSNLIILAASSIALLILSAIIRNPRPSPIRRVCGIVLDMVSLSIVMYWTAGDHVPLFVFYLWVTLGNGFRFGLKYLYISFAAGITGFGSVLLWSEYWQSHQSFGFSLLIILVALPLYAAVLIKKLHSAIDLAKHANEAKSRFLANMSHELRTPLNGVTGIGELLKETELSKEQRKLVDMMNSSANTLLELIEGVLDIAKIEAGKINIVRAPLDLHSLVNSVIYMLAPMGAKKKVYVSCSIGSDTPFSLHGDQQHIRQVLVNLVNNAIKFTDHGSVTLHVYRNGGTNDEPNIRFDITDTGIGIDPESIEDIFEDFTQAKISSSRKFEGTGLGTAISKELVELMDGHIGVESELNKGSTFWFELPFVALQQDSYESLSNHILLIASEDSASIIRPSLKSWQLDFDWVQSSARAVTLLLQAAEEGNHYHSTIIDQAVMTDVNPEQFAQMIRAEKQLDNLALILVNSSSSMIDANKINPNFITTLATLETRSLYNAIHAAQSVHFSDENVVSLVDHYQKRAADKPLSILVAEDNPVNQQVLRGILNRVGHEVTIVDSGEQVLDAVSENMQAFDLVILDKNMPEKSGIEVVKILRFLDSSHSLPIIMLTADATPEARTESIDAGSDAFLTKPIDTRALLEKIAILTNQIPSLANKLVDTKPVSLIHTGDEDALVIDTHALEELARLGENSTFIQNLAYDFLRDGRKHIQAIKNACGDDYPEFRESLHALKGSSTELGARELANYCLTGESFKPYQMGSQEVVKYIGGIDEVFARTERILVNIVKDINFHGFQNIDEDQGSLQ